jgi:hypothetical protein
MMSIIFETQIAFAATICSRSWTSLVVQNNLMRWWRRLLQWTMLALPEKIERISAAELIQTTEHSKYQFVAKSSW